MGTIEEVTEGEAWHRRLAKEQGMTEWEYGLGRGREGRRREGMDAQLAEVVQSLEIQS